ASEPRRRALRRSSAAQAREVRGFDEVARTGGGGGGEVAVGQGGAFTADTARRLRKATTPARPSPPAPRASAHRAGRERSDMGSRCRAPASRIATPSQLRKGPTRPQGPTASISQE